jgi:hypothetical protein
LFKSVAPQAIAKLTEAGIPNPFPPSSLDWVLFLGNDDHPDLIRSDIDEIERLSNKAFPIRQLFKTLRLIPYPTQYSQEETQMLLRGTSY